MTIFLSNTGAGLARAELIGQDNWSVEQIQPGGYFHCLVKDPANPGVVYAGIDDRGIWRSGDGGKDWQMVGLDGTIVKTVAVSPHNPDVVYAGTKPAGLYVSRDHTKTWRELDGFQRVPGRWWWFSPSEAPFQAYVQGIGVSPSDPNTLVVGVEFGAVVRSSDGGETWTGHRRGAIRDCHSLTFHAGDGDWVYEAGGTGGGAACSSDGGTTWTQPKKGLDRHYGWACAADPQQPDVWYASLSPGFTRAQPGVPAAHVDGHANAGIYRFREGAWQMLTGGLPKPLDYMAYALLTDPDYPGALWAGLSHGEVWHTADFGESWMKLPFSLGRIQRSLVRM